MLGWLKRNAPPVPDPQPVESTEQHPPEDRVGRLLGRLLTEHRSAEEHAAEQHATGALDFAEPSTETEARALDRHGPEGNNVERLPVADRGIVAPLADDDILDLVNPLPRPAGEAIEEAVEETPPEALEAAPGGSVIPLPRAAGEPVAQTAPEAPDEVIPLSRTANGGIEETAPEALEDAPDEAFVPLPRLEALRPTEPPPAIPNEIKPPRAVTRPAGGPAEGMFVIAICSQKGGAGKTTIAAHLAVCAGATGRGPVVLIDTDPQGSLAEWWRARSDDAPALATVKLEDLQTNLAELRSYGTAIAIIDTPPALTASIEQVIAVADLIVIPARPSPHDLRAIGATVEMVRKAGKSFLFVVNGAAPRASITAQAVAALSEHGRVVPVILYQRTDYAASMIDGRTVIEKAPSGRSAQEIQGLWQYVNEQIGVHAAA